MELKTKILLRIIDDNESYISLIRYIRTNNISSIKVYIKLGYNINYTGGLSYDRIPLHLAAMYLKFDNSRLEIFKLLIDNGANVNAIDKNGLTPFDYLREYIKDTKDINNKNRLIEIIKQYEN